MTVLAHNFASASPRGKKLGTPWASLAIHGFVATLFVVLLARAFGAPGLVSWGAGLVYVVYDTFLLGFTTWQTRGLAWRAPPAAAPAGRVSLGVIVAAHDEAAALPATIAALLAQDQHPDAIVIADDGSTDGTAAALAPFGLLPPALGGMVESSAKPGLFWLRLPHGGKSVALNTALERMSTAVVVTVDADTLLEPGAVAAMRAAFAAEAELVAATGVLVPVCGGGFAGRLFQWFQTYEYIRNFLSRYAWMRADGLLLISGAFAGFRRDAVIEVGGFDDDCLVEDYELIHRLRRHGALTGRGWRTRVLGHCLARTDAPATVPAFLRQRRRWFGGFLQTQFWYRDMVGNPAYGHLGTWMLPVKAADTLQPLYGLAALAIAFGLLARGHYDVLLPVSGVIGAKILIDLVFHLWSVHLYRRWTGDTRSNRFAYAFAAAVLEPFSFQFLRHAGAALGWVIFVSGRHSWGRKARTELVAAE
jgi:cellulose synthase/poly-beta-1,6-N-acetylglucosamine synthase-like glycosyltransferase